MRVSGDFDDRAYLCSAEKWVGVQSEQCPKTSHFSGIAVTWFPAMVLARLFAIFDSLSFESWAGFFVGITSFLCWMASLFLIPKIVMLYSKNWDESPLKTFCNHWLFSALFLLNIPVLYFATTRTFLVHSAELMWSLLFVYFWKKGKTTWCLIALVVTIFCRPNNIGACFLIPVLFSEIKPLSMRKKMVYRTALFASVIGFGFLLYEFIFHGYNGTYLLPALLDFNKRQFFSFFIRQDFGILWSQTLWLLGFLIWTFLFISGNDTQAAAGCWLFISGFLAILWPTHGSTFGYRYLIGSYGGVLILFLESAPKLLSKWSQKHFRGLFILMGFLALWGVLQCWIYPAPKPYWPWDKPADANFGIPFGQIFNWIKSSPDLFKMNRFSEIGQLLETLNFIPRSDFTRQGSVNSYAIEGSIGTINFFVTLLVVGFLMVVIFKKIWTAVFERRK